jgi:hypothetical protein
MILLNQGSAAQVAGKAHQASTPHSLLKKMVSVEASSGRRREPSSPATKFVAIFLSLILLSAPKRKRENKRQENSC